MGFFSFLDAFRSKPRSSRDHGIQMESPRRERQFVQDTSIRQQHGRHGSRTAIMNNNTTVPSSNDPSTKRRSMSRRRSWFGGKPDADEDIPAMPTLVRTDYNRNGGITSPTLGRSSRNNGSDYMQLPEDKRERRTSTFATRQNVTAIGALPPMPTNANNNPYTSQQPATSTLPAEQRRSRRQSIKSLHRSNSQVSTKSRRKSRSFWSSSNPDDEDGEEEYIPPVPALYNGASPDSARNDPFDEDDEARRGRGRSSTHGGGGGKQPRPVSTASRRSYVPKAAASGFLKSTNGASDNQRKSYRRSFNLGEGVELVCVTDEHRIEWEKLMNKHAKMDDSVFADSGENHKDGGDGEGVDGKGGNRFSNAQALAALEFGVRS